ncbi:GTP pyrophosphokinase [Bacillus cereus]|uniref:GTP pyrophosphokinase n=1 Tax=Bacillus cereus TaxID=1396 RepID=UPI000B4BFC98|nr:(p)ppGpp synthetase [Bacillus cereus]
MLETKTIRIDMKMKFEITEKEYDTHCKKYNNLGRNLEDSLKTLLNEASIGFLDVNYRIKDYNSFLAKIARKGYKDPLNDNEDFCGMRIICFFPSDIEKICNVINEEFNVHHSEDKSDKEIDKFGYRSYHFVVSVKEEWQATPNFRNLKDVKAEIQVRTILMHAWADIEHKLQYKKKEHIPKEIQRKFYQLSALFELADEQFEVLRDKKEEIYTSVASSRNFDTKQEMNADTLQAFLDLNMSERDIQEGSTSDLLDELLQYDISFDDLEKTLKEVGVEFQEDLEQKVMGLDYNPVTRWDQASVLRCLLDLTNDKFWGNRKDYLPNAIWERIEELRKGIKIMS